MSTSLDGMFRPVQYHGSTKAAKIFGSLAMKLLDAAIWCERKAVRIDHWRMFHPSYPPSPTPIKADGGTRKMKPTGIADVVNIGRGVKGKGAANVKRALLRGYNKAPLTPDLKPKRVKKVKDGAWKGPSYNVGNDVEADAVYF